MKASVTLPFSEFESLLGQTHRTIVALMSEIENEIMSNFQYHVPNEYKQHFSPILKRLRDAEKEAALSEQLAFPIR